MRSSNVLAVLVAAALAPAAFAQKTEPSKPAKPEAAAAVATAPGKGAAMQVVKASATVESVDPATRKVTLKLANGSTRTIVAGDEVKNFAQIKAGDKLTVAYMEALTIEL